MKLTTTLVNPASECTMALSKTELLSTIAQYQQDNKRPMAKRDILSLSGDAGEVLASLLVDGKVACRRGRNGGYFPTDTVAALTANEDAPVEAGNDPVSASDDEIDIGHLAEQFAALEARIAAEEAQNENSLDA
jgi:hypothetical protein